MPSHPPSIFHRIVWPLAVGETLVWASLFYAFPALLLTWERDLGWSKAELSGAFTVALLLSAVLAPLSGRLIDRGYGTAILTGGALLGAAGLVGLSMVQTVWQFYGVWFLIGIAMAGALYEPCFAILTRTMGLQRKRAITIVTLVAGFAGTISFPGNFWLVNRFGWRTGVLVLAGIVAFVVTPLLFVGSRTAHSHSGEVVEDVAPTAVSPWQISRTAMFWLLAGVFAVIALNHGVLLTHLLPLLSERGIAPGTAVFAASMIGPMQVFGRMVMLYLERRFSALVIFMVCLGSMIGAALSLLGAAQWGWLVGGFVLLQGAGYGATSILRPVVTADLLGKNHFGVIAGLLAIPFQGASAAAATVAALIWIIGGYNLVIWFAIAAAVVGIALLAVARLKQQ